MPAQAASDTLSAKQQAVPLIAAFMAASDMPQLNTALNQGLDAGMTISEAKEILVQLHASNAGFKTHRDVNLAAPFPPGTNS
ncbi:hypothetical protein G6F68_020323 [Rhizopus microsporus]|nr:hypothetical protein G6F68_020323 [Rhizopus microsporus]